MGVIMTKRNACFIAVPYLAALVLAAPTARHSATFRVITNFSGYQQPGAFLEGSPNVFYGVAETGSTQEPLVYSLATAGSPVTLATFPGQHLASPDVAGANGRFYAAVEQRANPGQIFSFTGQPGRQIVYQPQNFETL